MRMLPQVPPNGNIIYGVIVTFTSLSVMPFSLALDRFFGNYVLNYFDVFSLMLFFLFTFCLYNSVIQTPSLLFDVIDTYTEAGYWLTSFSFGYFLYDTWEMVTHAEYKSTTELVIHHILVSNLEKMFKLLTLLLPVAHRFFYASRTQF